MAIIFLFRHGETGLSEGRFCGAADPPLNERGGEQAARIGDYLRSRRIAAIYSSPKLRALQTAEPAAAALGLQVTTIADLREVDFGEWEGLTFDQARQRDPDIWRGRQDDPATVAPPNGETYGDLAARIVPAFQRLLERHPDDDVAVFGHKAANRVFLASVLEIPLANARRLGQEPGALSIVRSHSSQFSVLSINERCHLGFSAGDLCRALSGASSRE